MTSQRILGLDVGDARIGVALSDPTLLLASPLTIISRKDGHPVQAVAELVTSNAVSRLVVGLPKNMDGTLGGQARKVQKFALSLQELLPGVDLVYWDERRSTLEAHSRRMESGASKSKRAAHIDDAAAAVILQSYLDFLRLQGK